MLNDIRDEVKGLAKDIPASKNELKEVLAESEKLMESCGIAMVGSNDLDGYPNMKAMFKVETEGMKTIWFSTNTSSKRVAQFKRNPKACVYFADQLNFKGLMLVGEMEVLSDFESKKRLWSDGCEIFYPLGVNDPDYSVLRFTAKWGILLPWIKECYLRSIMYRPLIFRTPNLSPCPSGQGDRFSVLFP